jgi:hypothetical protein
MALLLLTAPWFLWQNESSIQIACKSYFPMGCDAMLYTTGSSMWNTGMCGKNKRVLAQSHCTATRTPSKQQNSNLKFKI